MWTTEVVGSGARSAGGRRGGALLAVLWLSAGLSAIAFTLANTVRGETERASTAVEGARAYFLAAGALERGILYVQWGTGFKRADGASPYYSPATPVLPMPFPAGEAEVEVIPESAKLNVNKASGEELLRLLEALGAAPDRALTIVQAILDWRSSAGGPTLFDQYYLSLTPSFRARHASMEEIEELLVLQGMTPELFYGWYDRDAQGQLFARGGLRDCVSVFGSLSGFDANTAHPALLAAIGLAPQTVAGIVARRRAEPFRSTGDLQEFGHGGEPGFGKLKIGGNSIFTLRATARARLQNGQLSDVRRSVAAMVKFLPDGFAERYHVLRWYDNAWRN